MNQDAMIDEIVARVAAKLAALSPNNTESAEPVPPAGRVDRERQPGLLVIAQGKPRLDLLRSERIAEYFYTATAPRMDHPANMETVQAVVLYDLSVGDMVKLSDGRCNNPYTALAAKAILSGKRMYAPKEFIELYRYKDTAPKPYFAMLEEKLNLLIASGLTVCPEAELEDRILADHQAGGGVPFPVRRTPPEDDAPVLAQVPEKQEKTVCAPQSTCDIVKKVLTERDVSEAAANKATVIQICEKCIVTDLAKEYAARRGIAIVRKEGRP